MIPWDLAEGGRRHSRPAGMGASPISTARKTRDNIRVGIVDDHPMFRLGLKKALEREPDLTIRWELGSAMNLDSVMRQAPVDVVLMDVYMGPGKDGIAATREIVDRWPDVRVAVISASVDVRSVAASTRAGASAFLPKAMPVSEMVASIRRLASFSGSGAGSPPNRPV